MTKFAIGLALFLTLTSLAKADRLDRVFAECDMLLTGITHTEFNSQLQHNSVVEQVRDLPIALRVAQLVQTGRQRMQRMLGLRSEIIQEQIQAKQKVQNLRSLSFYISYPFSRAVRDEDRNLLKYRGDRERVLAVIDNRLRTYGATGIFLNLDELQQLSDDLTHVKLFSAQTFDAEV
jgi:hypothetical protein